MNTPTKAEKLAVCQRQANELAKLNPSLRFLYDEGSVVCEHGEGKLMLVSSWTIFGSFIPNAARLDVTDYFQREGACVGVAEELAASN